MPESDSLLMKVLATVAVLCALTVTALTVRRQFSSQPPSATREPVFVAGWEDLAASGHALGRVDAPVTILEFADFECPICRQFTNSALRGVRARYGDAVRIVFRHWPLSYHRFAYPAARAAECAGEQNRFFPFHDLIYDKQDSLGLKSFESFAAESGVRDSVAFRACVGANDSVSAVSGDVAAAALAGGTGTPTILVNGLRLPGAPDSVTFDSLIAATIRQRTETQ
jgi:protein-disulfide isomerase